MQFLNSKYLTPVRNINRLLVFFLISLNKMSTVGSAAFLAIILLFQSNSVAANFTIPFLSPLFGVDPCKGDVCGKGKCVASTNVSFGFECECDEGWKQARDDDDQLLKFLPCIIPNCSINFNCARAPAPTSHNKSKNSSFFDPCFWTDCGGGSCNQTSLFTRTCLCEEGYTNLFNSTAFPCYKECAIGGDCKNLGLDITNSPGSSPSRNSTVVDSNSRASNLIPQVELGWLIIMVTTSALVVLMYS